MIVRSLLHNHGKFDENLGDKKTLCDKIVASSPHSVEERTFWPQYSESKCSLSCLETFLG